MTIEEIKKVFNSSTDHEKDVLKKVFAGKIDFNLPITERVKTFYNACDVLGISRSLPDVRDLPNEMKEIVIRFYKVAIIVKALNEGWEPDWCDKDQDKFTIAKDEFYDKLNPSYPYNYDIMQVTINRFNALIVFKSKELAAHFLTFFKDLNYDY